MYRISRYSSKIENTLTNEVFSQDDTEPLYIDYLEWFQNNNYPEIVDFFNGEEELSIFEKQKETEFLAYEKRCLDGRIAYNRLNAEFRVLKENGAIPQAYYDMISEVLLPVRNEVLAGQWISALQKLESIGSALIGIDLYNRLYAQITNYISINY